MGADADGGQLLLRVEGLGPLHGGVSEVVQVAERTRAMEQVAKQFLDAAVGAVAHQEQGQDQPLQPSLGDRQVEQDGVLGRGRGEEGLGEGVLSLVGLLVDEFAADVVVKGQLGDGVAGEGVQGELLACCGGQGVRGAARGGDSGAGAG